MVPALGASPLSGFWSAMYCTIAGPSVRISPLSSLSTGTWPLGFTSRKSPPDLSFLLCRLTCSSSNGRPDSRSTICGESEHAPGEKYNLTMRSASSSHGFVSCIRYRYNTGLFGFGGDKSSHICESAPAELGLEGVLRRCDHGVERALDVAPDRAARIGIVVDRQAVLVLHVDGAIDVEQRDLARRPHEPRAGHARRRLDQPGMRQHRQQPPDEAGIRADAARDHFRGQALAVEILDQRQHMHRHGETRRPRHGVSIADTCDGVKDRKTWIAGVASFDCSPSPKAQGRAQDEAVFCMPSKIFLIRSWRAQRTCRRTLDRS